MQYLGTMKTWKAVGRAALKFSRQCHCTVVIEKALCRSYPSPKRHVCYRAWADKTIKKPQVIDIKDWKKTSSYKKTSRRMRK